MNVDNMVLEFIRNSRRSVHDDNPSELEEARLKALFIDCLSLIANHRNKAHIPTLILCNTYDKYSTILPIRLKQNEHKYYLLYDVHLNKINRLLNAIYYSDQDPGHDIWIYRISVGTDKSDITNIDFRKSPVALFAEIKELLSELYEAYEKTFQEQEYVELIHEQKKLVLGNDCLLEECFADAIAYAITFTYVKMEYPNDQGHLFLAGQALFLEMMNLQLLAMQHMAVAVV